MPQTDKPDHHIEVAVMTTNGRWPKGTEFDREAVHQPVAVELQQAKNKLNIASTEGWIATVDDKEIDPNKSYADNQLFGRIVIQYGPRAGGGGRA